MAARYLNLCHFHDIEESRPAFSSSVCWSETLLDFELFLALEDCCLGCESVEWGEIVHTDTVRMLTRLIKVVYWCPLQLDENQNDLLLSWDVQIRDLH